MADSFPAEETHEHTRILRVMLATEDCVAYWRVRSEKIGSDDRARLAFDERWFGNKSEPRVKTLLGDMALRFDAYPAALSALRVWSPPREVSPWICHFHTQLADPIYRRFSGEFLPNRRRLGYATVDREIVARWVQDEWAGKWSPTTCVKFGSNMLATAYEAGLLRDRTDPRKLVSPRPPRQAVEYLLYLLREVEVQGGLLESPYIRSIAPEPELVSAALRGLDAVRIFSSGDVRSFEWAYPNLASRAESQSAAATPGASESKSVSEPTSGAEPKGALA